MKKFIYNWFIKWYNKHYYYKISIEKFTTNRGNFFNDCRVKQRINDGFHNPPFGPDFFIIDSLLKYYRIHSKYSIINKLCNILNTLQFKFFLKLYNFWVKKNHLVDYGDKETYRILSPTIHDDISKLCSQDLIYYICLLEKYGKKELESWGFEKRPPKKLGKLKKLWYDITLTVY